jgi:hypothetical protein
MNGAAQITCGYQFGADRIGARGVERIKPLVNLRGIRNHHFGFMVMGRTALH